MSKRKLTPRPPILIGNLVQIRHIKYACLADPGSDTGSRKPAREAADQSRDLPSTTRQQDQGVTPDPSFKRLSSGSRGSHLDHMGAGALRA